MFGYPCAFVNRNMFAGLFGEEMFLRLTAAERAKMMKNQGAKPFEPMPGRVMKEYIIVPSGLLGNSPGLKRLIARSMQFAKTLKPKMKKAPGGDRKGVSG